MKKAGGKYKSFFSEAPKTMAPESVARAEKKTDQIVLNLQLNELRKHLGVKQVDVKGFSQSGVSKIESREDLRISTLISYCRALGMGLEIKAVPGKITGKTRARVLFRSTPSAI